MNPDFFLPQTFGGLLTIVRFNRPLSWNAFDTVRLTVAQNAVLKKIVNAGSEATILDYVMACISIYFLRSFDIIFPGHGLVTYCQHVTEYPHELNMSAMSLPK
jgi:hypothetical protein